MGFENVRPILTGPVDKQKIFIPSGHISAVTVAVDRTTWEISKIVKKNKERLLIRHPNRNSGRESCVNIIYLLSLSFSSEKKFNFLPSEYYLPYKAAGCVSRPTDGCCTTLKNMIVKTGMKNNLRSKVMEYFVRTLRSWFLKWGSSANTGCQFCSPYDFRGLEATMPRSRRSKGGKGEEKVNSNHHNLNK